ncbi:MAG: GNAT family N-acetyltransferase [Rhizobacter sp.]|nr:GNAT family N-acetyltransferase [Rhizobacter sp.]
MPIAIAIAVRRATPADLMQVLDLCALLDAADEPRLSVAAAEARFSELMAREGHDIYVAEAEGEVVGTFALVFIGGLAHTAHDSAVVEDMAVAAGRQGSGIGRQMIDFAMQQCALRGCYKLALSSHLRRSAAHRFYEGLGFRKHGYSYLIDGSVADARSG